MHTCIHISSVQVVSTPAGEQTARCAVLASTWWIARLAHVHPWVCMYVCMCVHVYVYILEWCWLVYTSEYVCMCKCMYECELDWRWLVSCMYACMCVCIWAQLVLARAQQFSMYVCIYVCAMGWYRSVYIHICVFQIAEMKLYGKPTIAAVCVKVYQTLHVHGSLRSLDRQTHVIKDGTLCF